MHIISICKCALALLAVDINRGGVCESLDFRRNCFLLHQKKDSD